MLVFQQGNNCDYQKSGGAECTQGFICNHSITSLSREHPSTVSQASLTSLYHHYEYFTIFFCFSFLFHLRRMTIRNSISTCYMLNKTLYGLCRYTHRRSSIWSKMITVDPDSFLSFGNISDISRDFWIEKE